jgi:hypothetical protein
VAITPIVGCQNLLSKMSELHDLETATGNCLEQLALWTGTPLIIPGAAQLEYFGFIDQENAMTFGETDDPSIGYSRVWAIWDWWFNPQVIFKKTDQGKDS